MANIDLNILPLHRQAGSDLSRLPGLHIAEASRKASRSRRADQLMILLSFNLPAFSDARQDELLTRLEEIYFEKSGSTTMAMRELIEDLNSLILNLNLKHAGSRPQVTGTVAVIVVRGDHLFLAQNGPGHMFALLPSKVDYLHDEKLTARGLGLNRNAQIYYAQMPVEPGIKMLFSTSLPDGWDADTFKFAYTHPLHKAQQRFLEDAGEELKAVLLDVQSGRGKMTLLRAPEAAAPSQQSVAQSVVPPPGREEEKPQPQPLEEEAGEVSSEPPDAPREEHTASASARPPVQQVERPGTTPRREQPAPPPIVSTAPLDDPYAEQAASEPAVSSPEAERAAASLAPAILGGLKRVQSFGLGILRGLKKLLQRMVPGDELIKIPTSTMAFIAVAVPLLVVTVAALVYAQVGRNQQYENLFSQAETLASAAAAEPDIEVKRQNWQESIGLIDQATEFLVTDEAEDLRKQAVSALDAIDNVTRLNFEQAISGALAPSIKIRNMAATSRDLYMLDIDSDSVLRAWLAGTRYEMDREFRCGAGQYGAIIVQELVDIALLPDNPDDALLVAMDRGGNLLYCYEDKPPVAITLTPPDSYWGNPIAITVENGQLYVLDEQLNMIWFFEPGDQNYQFRDAPKFFFTEEVPDMTDTIDFAIDQEQLYLLYLSGETTTCTYTGLAEAPTSCTSPTLYSDPRPGRESGATIEGAVFYQLQHTQPPEPSLFYLDPINHSIYHFSLKLNLVQQYRSAVDLEGQYITAFAISPTKTVFIALENQVYLAHLP
jgi:hypothetical protein